MKLGTQMDKGGFALSAVATALLIGGTMQSALAADPDPFEGVATVCAISQAVIDPPEQKGNSGVLYKYDMKFYYLIESDGAASLVNGWEDQSNNWKQTKSGTDFYWGSSYFIPDDHPDSALEENFRFKAEEILAGISGTWKGTGDLEGVTVDYELSPPYQVMVGDTPFPERCWEYTLLCADCYPALTPGADGVPGNEDDTYTQYEMSGWVEGY